MKKILFVVGSLRKQSFNRQLAEKVEQLLAGKAEVTYLEYSALPFVNQDEEYPAPEEVARVRAEVVASDAVWIFSPEYNNSYPGLLKNLLDWLSRPVVSMDYTTPTSISGKKVALSGVGGRAATVNCRAKLTELLTLIKADVLEIQTGIALQSDAWTSNQLLLSPADEQHLAVEATALLASL